MAVMANSELRFDVKDMKLEKSDTKTELDTEIDTREVEEERKIEIFFKGERAFETIMNNSVAVKTQQFLSDDRVDCDKN